MRYQTKLFSGCEGCPLNDGRRKVFGEGPSDAEIVVIGEATGWEEEKRGIPFCGASGGILRAALRPLSAPLFFTNSVRCHPRDEGGRYRTPTADEIRHCADHTEAELSRLPKAKKIIAVGATALRQLTRQSGITKVLGTVIEKDVYRIYPLLHSAAGLHSEQHKKLFAQSVARVLGQLNGADRDGRKPGRYALLTTVGGVQEALASCAAEDRAALSVDCETDRGQVTAVAWSGRPGEGFVVLTPRHAQSPWTEEQWSQVWGLLATYLENESVPKIGQNLKFDLRALKLSLDIGLRNIQWDAMLASHVATMGRKYGHDLGNLAAQYTDMPEWKSEEKRELEKYGLREEETGRLPAEVLVWYAGSDVDAVQRLYHSRLREEAPDGLSRFMAEASEAVGRMECRGVTVDLKFLDDLDAHYEKEEEALLRELRKFGGRDFNPSSNDQVGGLCERLKIPTHGGRTATGKLAVGRGSLTEAHPFSAAVLRYRKVAKLRATYIRGLREAAKRYPDGRVRTEYFLGGTETGRFSSRHPNLQNLEPKIRPAFVAGPGCRLLYADYSQAELRVAAMLSGDPVLTEIFQKGGDLHDEVGDQMLPDFRGHDDPRRTICKGINFGVIYGIGPAHLAVMTGITEAAAEEYLRRYFLRFRRFKTWADAVNDEARRRGYVTGLFGRRRLVERQTQFVNSVVQGSTHDILTAALIELDRRGYRLLLDIHDALIIEVPARGAETAAEKVTAIMENVGDYAERCFPGIRRRFTVPLKVDVKIFSRWEKEEDSWSQFSAGEETG